MMKETIMQYCITAIMLMLLLNTGVMADTNTLLVSIPVHWPEDIRPVEFSVVAVPVGDVPHQGSRRGKWEPDLQTLHFELPVGVEYRVSGRDRSKTNERIRIAGLEKISTLSAPESLTIERVTMVEIPFKGTDIKGNEVDFLVQTYGGGRGDTFLHHQGLTKALLVQGDTYNISFIPNDPFLQHIFRRNVTADDFDENSRTLTFEPRRDVFPCHWEMSSQLLADLNTVSRLQILVYRLPDEHSGARIPAEQFELVNGTRVDRDMNQLDKGSGRKKLYIDDDGLYEVRAYYRDGNHFGPPVGIALEPIRFKREKGKPIEIIGEVRTLRVVPAPTFDL